MTLTIYGIARSRAVRTLWMAEELGIPYQHDPVAFGPEGAHKPQYRAMNPNGRIPFIDDDGLVLFESMAINLYLVRKHGGPMAPANLAEEGQMTMWTLWAATELEPKAAQAMYHTAFYPPEQRNPAIVVESLEGLKAPLAVMEAALVKGGGWLVGGRFTVADANVFGCMFYLRFNPDALAPYPAIRAWQASIQARPAWQAALKLRGD